MEGIKTVNLTKRYGRVEALSNINLEIPAAQCCGLIGSEGAGKTRLIQILATLLQPSWGEARIHGYVVGPESRKIRPMITYVPQRLVNMPDMVIQEYMEYFAGSFGVNDDIRAKAIGDALELTGLAEKRHRLVNNLSTPLRQRLAFARALIPDAKVFLLDNPFSTLDPRSRNELQAIVNDLRGMKRTILLATDDVGELAAVCDYVVVLTRGSVAFSGSLDAFLGHRDYQGTYYVGVLRDAERAHLVLSSVQEIDAVQVVHERCLRVTYRAGVQDEGRIAQQLIQAGISLTSVEEERPMMTAVKHWCNLA